MQLYLRHAAKKSNSKIKYLFDRLFLFRSILKPQFLSFDCEDKFEISFMVVQ